MSEMACFPNPITGKLKDNYVDIMKKLLEEGLWLFYINFKIFFQKATFIQAVLTVSELKTLLQNSVEATRKDSFITRMGVRKSLKNLYEIKKEDDILLSDLLKAENLVFMRSSMS